MKIALVVGAFVGSLAYPEQIHISVTGIASEMHVSWATLGSCSGSGDVAWAPAAGGAAAHATATCQLFTLAQTTPKGLWDGTMTGLAVDTRYTYTLGGNASSGGSFTNQPAHPRVYAVYGDFGDVNDVSIGQLKTEAASGAFDMVLHVGDMAYDLSSSGGNVGDAFMRDIAPVASVVPYVSVVGNHERAAAFAHFIARWGGMQSLASNSHSSSPLWLSFDDGLVHFIGIDTEVYFYGTAAQVTAQKAWLEADLAAVDRAVTPWVVALGHKQGWMDSSSGNGGSVKDLELIMQGRVDVFFSGHQHSYQRLLPLNGTKVETDCVSADNATYTNCRDMVSVISGSPGCRELVSKGHAPVGMVVFSETYGFGHLTVVSNETLTWQWEQLKVPGPDGELVAQPGAFFDAFTIHRTKQRTA